jgi:hypothetical protein
MAVNVAYIEEILVKFVHNRRRRLEKYVLPASPRPKTLPEGAWDLLLCCKGIVEAKKQQKGVLPRIELGTSTKQVSKRFEPQTSP